MNLPDLLAPDPIVDELCDTRDAIAALDHNGITVDRDEVLGLLRARIDQRVFGETA